MRNSLTLKGASRAVAAEALRKASAQLALAQSAAGVGDAEFADDLDRLVEMVAALQKRVTTGMRSTSARQACCDDMDA